MRSVIVDSCNANLNVCVHKLEVTAPLRTPGALSAFANAIYVQYTIF